MLFGIITPLSAIHSRTSCYRGDFTDLSQLIEIIASVGATYLQLLPIQDSGGTESPYTLHSWFAIDIRYLFVDELKTEKPLTLKEQISLKREKMRAQYEHKKSSPDFFTQLTKFRETHPWVFPYACFKVLKAKFNGLPWWQWEDPYKAATPTLFSTLETTFFDSIQLEIFIQMSCFSQMGRAFQKAENLNVALCCDLPHFCNRDSAEGWNQPNIFLPHSTAGAPPDQYSPHGQNWNLAPWNWAGNYNEVLKLWQDRNTLFASYFTHARVDHAVGLFRQWVIPEETPGSHGSFHPGDLNEALSLGKKNFSELKNSSLHLVAENLGTIPPEVNKILNDLQILGTIVWRWNRSWHTQGAPFIPIKEMDENNLLSMTTHDSSSLEGWAQSEFTDFSFFCKSYALPLSSDSPAKKPVIDAKLRFQIFSLLQSSPCKIKAELIEEFLLLEERFGYSDPDSQRVNDPANSQKNNWSYRCKVDLETLKQSTSWKEKMEKIIACNRA